MQLELVVVDAFTATPFSGNPAAIAVVSEFPQDSVMQLVAHYRAEIDLSLTYTNGRSENLAAREEAWGFTLSLGGKSDGRSRICAWLATMIELPIRQGPPESAAKEAPILAAKSNTVGPASRFANSRVNASTDRCGTLPAGPSIEAATLRTGEADSSSLTGERPSRAICAIAAARDSAARLPLLVFPSFERAV